VNQDASGGGGNGGGGRFVEVSPLPQSIPPT